MFVPAGRLWPFDHPLGQCNLPAEILFNVSQHIDELSLDEISETPANEIGNLIKMNERNGQMVKTAAKMLPRFNLRCKVQPLTRNLLQVQIQAERRFVWDTKVHGNSQAFWLFVADAQDVTILRASRIMFRSSMPTYSHTFTVPIEHMPEQLIIRMMSDAWLDSEDVVQVPTSSLSLPVQPSLKIVPQDLPPLACRGMMPSNQPLLDVSLLPATLDAIQTSVFHTLVYTSSNTVVCASEESSHHIFLAFVIW